ncbi:hypothetical protein ABBQ32_004701 [Trebouxia sp. C0010 RCD-2024]
MLLTCSYNQQEFMRVGYYVSTDYFEEEYREMESPPNPPLIHKYVARPCMCFHQHYSKQCMIRFHCCDCRLVRNILADKPRVTRFPIDFDAVSAAPAVKPVEALAAGTTTEMEV